MRQTKPVDPKNRNLQQTLGKLARCGRSRCGNDLDIRLDPKLENTQADPGQLEQVVMNLVINARDALPHGGKIQIQTAGVYLDQVYGQNLYVRTR